MRFSLRFSLPKKCPSSASFRALYLLPLWRLILMKAKAPSPAMAATTMTVTTGLVMWLAALLPRSWPAPKVEYLMLGSASGVASSVLPSSISLEASSAGASVAGSAGSSFSAWHDMTWLNGFSKFYEATASTEPLVVHPRQYALWTPCYKARSPKDNFLERKHAASTQSQEMLGGYGFQ